MKIDLLKLKSELQHDLDVINIALGNAFDSKDAIKYLEKKYENISVTK